MPNSFVSVSAAPRRVAAAAATLCAALALAGCASQGPAHEPLARLGAADLGLTAQSGQAPIPACPPPIGGSPWAMPSWTA